MSRPPSRPNLFLSTTVVVGLTIIWGLLRLVLFADSVFSLTFVLPLLVCVWSQRRWHLWGMTAAFVIMTFVKAARFIILDIQGVQPGQYFATTLFNIGLGALVVHFLILYRARIESDRARIFAQNAKLEAQTERLQQQNTELETQAEELSQQNEEIKTQSEELAQQYEEIEAQTEELAQHNEELSDANQRMRSREDLLQAMLDASRRPDTSSDALADLCERALAILGGPASALAVLEQNDTQLELRARTGQSHLVPERWPVAGSLGHVVLEEDRTAYVSDLAAEPTLNAPFGADGPVRSLLATPLRIAGRREGIVIACSTAPAHWSEEQFRLIEWFAAQCGSILEAQRWQVALQHHARDAQAANEAKDRFLAMLSHELRTPLTPVLAAAGALAKDESLPPAVREELAMIRRNIRIQNRLVDDLLDLTRIARGKMLLEHERVNLAALVQSALDITTPDLDARDQRLSVNLAALDDCHLLGDSARLQQVFWNLLKNAVKFSPPRSEITVSAERRDQRIVIRVQDQGVGLTSADLERIFLPFEQVQASGSADHSGGLGLGLAIARTIVELHGGTLHAESDGASHGATFVIELPVLSGAPGARSATHSPAPTSAPLTPLRILLTEDHPDTGRVITRLLQGAGHKVEHVASAERAIELIAPGKFDLLVSDLGLPDFDGYELIRRIRAIDPDLKAICMSGYGTENDIQRARDAGFSEHLTKPVELNTLHSAIARISQQTTPRRGPA